MQLPSLLAPVEIASPMGFLNLARVSVNSSRATQDWEHFFSFDPTVGGSEAGSL